ncbi:MULTISPECIES: hypothetical protein [unclassified Rhizobium]|uniref:hypothetical protein n=1 Tax=unclassified Rhizobium TaxID=2613769 RepID=UPI00160FD2CC|nr:MULTISPECIES: hypothetical protein [unclassified Rhizobium]MBB3297843.1 hypothetical protein [Rhizobium sp. BK112]MBB4177662.1 hypothetical protein [Rhizobium sp. BK109]
MRPMWCDDFDTDLLKVVPGIPELLGDLAGVTLWTHAGTWEGTLNHPSMWNHDTGLICFFGFNDPDKPDYFSTGQPPVQCTVLEMFRDLWCHGATVMMGPIPVWDSQPLQPEFDILMYAVRGWFDTRPNRIRLAQLRARKSIRQAADCLRQLIAGQEAFKRAIAASKARTAAC